MLFVMLCVNILLSFQEVKNRLNEKDFADALVLYLMKCKDQSEKLILIGFNSISTDSSI